MSKYKTSQRKKLIDYFESNIHHTLSAQDIYVQLKEQGISLSAIYRNLAEMEKDGVICRVSENNRYGVLYQYTNKDECAGAVHLKCENCSTTLHLNSNIAHMMTGFVKDEYGFAINCSNTFLYGKCEKCSQSEKENKLAENEG